MKIKDNELDQLYAQDNDWNELLPLISEKKTAKEKTFQEVLAGFSGAEDFIVSLRTLKTAMSAVIFKNHTKKWRPKKLEEYLKQSDKYELVKAVVNDERKTIIAITAERTLQKWTDNTDLLDLSWKLYLIHWNEQQGLLFIHSSDNDGFHEEVAKVIIGERAEKIDGQLSGQIFRCLDGIKLFKIQNVGLIQLLGKLIRFQMSVGTDIEQALTKAQLTRARKSHVFGVGYENGNQVTIGCSYKGRIWSQVRDDIDEFIKWCEHVGRKVLDDTIDTEKILRGARVPTSIRSRPAIFPVCIDWNDKMYQDSEDRFNFEIDEQRFSFYESELVLIEASATGNIKFGLECRGDIVAKFEYKIFLYQMSITISKSKRFHLLTLSISHMESKK
ncbi:MAG: hypothetical protein IPM55_14930 [Acidobacteria bacterium]|nr:hypothetical protein [Acidobacteriota bacterium]